MPKPVAPCWSIPRSTSAENLLWTAQRTPIGVLCERRWIIWRSRTSYWQNPSSRLKRVIRRGRTNSILIEPHDEQLNDDSGVSQDNQAVRSDSRMPSYCVIRPALSFSNGKGNTHVAMASGAGVVDSIRVSPVVVSANLPGMDDRGQCDQLDHDAPAPWLGVLCRYLAPGLHIENNGKRSNGAKME